jgi:hypothetical protein
MPQDKQGKQGKQECLPARHLPDRQAGGGQAAGGFAPPNKKQILRFAQNDRMGGTKRASGAGA